MLTKRSSYQSLGSSETLSDGDRHPASRSKACNFAHVLRVAGLVDALQGEPTKRFTMVLTNPPSSKNRSIAISGQNGDIDKEDLVYKHNDFCTATKNKQMNFVLHVKISSSSYGNGARTERATPQPDKPPGGQTKAVEVRQESHREWSSAALEETLCKKSCFHLISGTGVMPDKTARLVASCEAFSYQRSRR